MKEPKYAIVVPTSGSVGTRNPHKLYFGYGQLYENVENANITNDPKTLEGMLKIKKRENNIYRNAFIGKLIM